MQTGRSCRSKHPTSCSQGPKTEVELNAARREWARKCLVELKSLYLQLGEAEKSKVRGRLNELTRVDKSPLATSKPLAVGADSADSNVRQKIDFALEGRRS